MNNLTLRQGISDSRVQIRFLTCIIATILLVPCIFKNYTLNILLVSKLDKILDDKDAWQTSR